MSNIKSVIRYNQTDKSVSSAGIYWSYMHKSWSKRDYHKFQCAASDITILVIRDSYLNHGGIQPEILRHTYETHSIGCIKYGVKRSTQKFSVLLSGDMKQCWRALESKTLRYNIHNPFLSLFCIPLSQFMEIFYNLFCIILYTSYGVCSICVPQDFWLDASVIRITVLND